MNLVNRICPKCNNPNYVVSLGNFSSAFKYKCMNCNSYLREEDFWPAQKDDNNGWISVKDRLPELAPNEYLVVNGGKVQLATFIDGMWITPHRVSSITHWMPLPEPPKEET